MVKKTAKPVKKTAQKEDTLEIERAITLAKAQRARRERERHEDDARLTKVFNRSINTRFSKESQPKHRGRAKGSLNKLPTEVALIMAVVERAIALAKAQRARRERPRAMSGHVAALPGPAMNVRRFIGSPRRRSPIAFPGL